MARESLADLLKDTGEEPAPATLPPPPPRASEAAAAATATPRPAGRQRRARRPRPEQTPEVTESQTPKWMTLERKELRLRSDQVDELARLRRSLNRRRNGDGERITDNTLIRVAVDLLLSRSGKLRGATEDELRKSVTP